MNTILLELVRDQIKYEPRQYNQGDWFSDQLPDGSIPPNCGTAACIAGHAMAIALGFTPEETKIHVGLWLFRPDLLLGLYHDQANRLYYEENWPKKFRSSDRASVETRAKRAVARINHFIRTLGRE